MNKNKNYYEILNVSKESTEKEIKKSYYKLSFKLHPDRNKDVDTSLFNEISEAYNVLCSDLREEYDIKSKWGKNYNEYFELFDIDFGFSYEEEKERLNNFKKNEVNNIQIDIDDKFKGTIEYERWVKCKPCDGTGNDSKSKIVIKDELGNIIKTFDGEEGCDFCEGSGKDFRNQDCSFCLGRGKIGLAKCSTCLGERRILGKQKINGIKITGAETKIESMGHFSKEGKVGYLIINKK
jgi:molecular chaperone DnaJ